MSASPIDEVAALITKIKHEAEINVGVETYDSLLLELLTAIQSAPEGRREFVGLLLPLVADWPAGAVEILELTMHTLRWPEIRAALEDSAANDPDFRHRRLAQYALAAFEDDWADGDIYSLYRED